VIEKVQTFDDIFGRDRGVELRRIWREAIADRFAAWLGGPADLHDVHKQGRREALDEAQRRFDELTNGSGWVTPDWPEELEAWCRTKADDVTIPDKPSEARRHALGQRTGFRQAANLIRDAQN
jgi:hypothetical protein